MLNLVICISISIAALSFAIELFMKRESGQKKSLPSLYAFVFFWTVVSIIYILTSLRFLSSWNESYEIDLQLFKVTVFAFTILSVPIAFLVTYVLTGKSRYSSLLASFFFIFGTLYANDIFKKGFDGPTITEWGTIYAFGSELSTYIYIFGLFVVPTAMILGILGLTLLRKMPKRKRYHITFSLLAISFVLDFVLVDLISTNPGVQIGSRIFILIGTTLGYLAHFTPMKIEKTLGIQESAIDEDKFDNEDGIELMIEDEVSDNDLY